MTLLAQQKDQQKKHQPRHYEQLPPPTADSTPAQPPRGPYGPEAGLGDLITQLGEQVSRLVRDELALAQLDAKKRAKWAGLGGGALGAGGGLAFFAACCFVTAAVLALAMVMRPWAAALAVGAALIVASGLLGTPGLVAMMRARRGIGQDSVESVKADIAALRAAAHK